MRASKHHLQPGRPHAHRGFGASLRALPLVLLGACWGKGPSTVKVIEETILPFRQPGSDPSQPEMFLLRDEGDGTYQTLRPKAVQPPGSQALVWGKRYVISVKTVSNPTWSTTTRSVEAVVSESVAINTPFRMRSISAPFFARDKRSFVDGKAFGCRSSAVCADLDAAIATGKPFDMAMQFGGSVDAALVVTSVGPPTDGNRVRP